MSPTVTVKGYDANNNYLGVLDSQDFELGGGLPITTGTNTKLDGFVYKLTGDAWATMASVDGTSWDIQNKHVLISDKLRINSRQVPAQTRSVPHNAMDIACEFDFGSWDGNTNTWTTEYQEHQNRIFKGFSQFLYNTWDEMTSQTLVRNASGFNELKQSTYNQDYSTLNGAVSNFPFLHDEVLGTQMGYVMWNNDDGSTNYPSWLPVGGHNPNEQDLVVEGHPLPVGHSSIRVKGQILTLYIEGYLNFTESILANNNTSGHPLEVGTFAFQDLGYNGQQSYKTLGTVGGSFSDIGGVESFNNYNEFIAASDSWIEQNIVGRAHDGDRSMQFVATVNLDEAQPDVWDYGIFDGSNYYPSTPVKTKLQTIPAGLDWYTYPYIWPTYTRPL